MIPKEDNLSMIDSLASKALGVPQEQSVPAPAPAQVQVPETPQGQASVAGSPDTEGDKIAKDSIIYQIDMGDLDPDGKSKPREFNEGQIKGVMNRYSSLNHEHAKYKPVMDVIKQYMSQNPNVTTGDLAKTLENLQKAQEPNPTMGNTDGDVSGQIAQPQEGDPAQMLKQWAEDNAVAAPPGYEQILQAVGNQGQLQQQLTQVQQMLAGVMQGAGTVANAARDQVQSANDVQSQAAKEAIANNLDRTQMALGLPDEDANPFMIYAAERGYTLEDFIDPSLAMNVMGDFKNNKNSPEMERLMDIAKKRQAYTGSLGSTPTAGPAGVDAADPSTFDAFSAKVMAKRGLG